MRDLVEGLRRLAEGRGPRGSRSGGGWTIEDQEGGRGSVGKVAEVKHMMKNDLPAPLRAAKRIADSDGM